jgi:hypothetical protein
METSIFGIGSELLRLRGCNCVEVSSLISLSLPNIQYEFDEQNTMMMLTCDKETAAPNTRPPRSIAK